MSEESVSVVRRTPSDLHRPVGVLFTVMTGSLDIIPRLTHICCLLRKKYSPRPWCKC